MAEEDEFDLPMPLGGVSDAQKFSDQPPFTTREAFNARSEDPTNGRERISQRAGLSEANSGTLDGANRVIELVSTVYDSRNLTYSFTGGAESQEWSAESPSKESVFHGVTDRAGNVYIADGPAGVAKFNPDGTVLWQFPLPVKDKNHFVRFVYVDELFDVYAGVSDGTRQDLGQLWKLTQLPEDEVEIAWTVELDAFVEEAKVYRDKLYTIQNENDTGSAFVRIYGQLDALLPKLEQEYRVPWPAHGMDVSTKGDVFVASGLAPRIPAGGDEYTRRNPKFPQFSAESQNWTPYDLDDWEKRIWSWHEADDITEFDVFGALAQDVKIRRWPDRSPHKRHLYEGSTIGKKPPTLALKACMSHAAVRFNGEDQALVSLSNPSIKKSSADQQKTIWPAYEGSAFCTILVVRPERRDSGNPMWIMGQHNSAAGASDHIVIANRDDGSALPGSFEAGMINHYATTDAGTPGQGTNGHPLKASFSSAMDIAIIVILWDGGLQPGDTSKTRSLFQLNGLPVDRYEGEANTTKEPTVLGWFDNPSSGFDHFAGDFLAQITLDLKDRDTLTEPIILSHDHLETGSANTDQTVNELTKLVGYFAHRFGAAGVLPADTETFTHPYGPQSETVFTTIFSDALTGPPDDSNAHLERWGRFGRRYPILTKWNPAGELVWAINGEEQDGTASNNGVVGVGLGVRVDSEGNLFSIGEDPGLDGTPSTKYLLKIIDQGDDFSIQTADGAWGVDIGAPAWDFPRMAVDKFDNVYVPVATGTNGLRVYKGSDGTLISDVAVGVPEREIYAVAIDPRIPEYGDDLTTPLARFAYAFGQAGADPPLPVYKFRLVQESPLAGSPRQHVHLAISSGGAIKRYEQDGAVFTAPSGAAGALSATPFYVQAVAAFEKAYITDSVSKIQVFDPREDTVSALESTSAGSPPHGAKLVELFHGRLVFARAPGLIGGAFDWACSRINEPTDWDNFPPARDPAAAIAGENEFGPGMAPDIINCLIPIGDDFLYLGCDHSIWMLSGDPGDGGQFDLVSDKTGIAFGRPYCFDPEGNVWFIGSRGGLFVMPPGGRPTNVSHASIEERLRSINFATHYVRLEWNHDDDGLHILRFPFGSDLPDPVEHWFWDKRRMAPWPDTFGSADEPNVEPSAVYVVDGDDPNDRRLLFGCRDGKIRRWDPDAKDDDGTAIDFNVLVGPLAGSTAKREMRFVGPRVVLAGDQDGAMYELFATDDPMLLGVPRHIGELGPGRNPLKRSKMRGSYCYVRFRNSVTGQRAAIEEAVMRAYAAGLKRVRETP